MDIALMLTAGVGGSFSAAWIYMGRLSREFWER